MRTVTYGAACSLDGFIAGADGAIDWLHFSKDVQQVMADYWKGVDTILMGRKTYEAAVKMGAGGGSMPGVSTYIFSTTMAAAPQGATLVAHDAGAFVRKLKLADGGGICVMGGGELACSLIREGVVDEVGLNIHPVLLGTGIPFFHDAGRVDLTLRDSRVIDGGCVLANYLIRSRPPA